MGQVIPLFRGRPPVALISADRFSELNCRLADQEAALAALQDQLDELMFCLLNCEPA